MAAELTAENLRAYQHRAWELVRQAKERFRAEAARAGGPEAGLRLSEALWLHARDVAPGWPDEAARRADLRHHLRLAERIERAAHAFARR